MSFYDCYTRNQLATRQGIRQNPALQLLLDGLSFPSSEALPKSPRRQGFENLRPLRPRQVDPRAVETGRNLLCILNHERWCAVPLEGNRVELATQLRHIARQHEPHKQLFEPLLPVLRSFVPAVQALRFVLRNFRFRPLRFQKVGNSVYLVSERFGVRRECSLDAL